VLLPCSVLAGFFFYAGTTTRRRSFCSDTLFLLLLTGRGKFVGDPHLAVPAFVVFRAWDDVRFSNVLSFFSMKCAHIVRVVGVSGKRQGGIE